MAWTPPLELETFFVSIFSGTPLIFTAIAIMVITGMAGYFRMNGFGMFVMIGMFALLFAEVVPLSLVVIIAIFGGLGLGYMISNLTSK